MIYVAGSIATGRHIDEVGAHVAGNNAHSIGICMVGTDKFTPVQWGSLKTLVCDLGFRYATKPGAGPGLKIVGHRDLSPDIDNDGVVEPWEWLKTCPGFDVSSWLARGMSPDPAHILQTDPPAAAALRQAA